MPQALAIAIIGAGMSGLAAAHTCLDAGHRVTLFEKSRGVGGRVATRRNAGFIYDHGAQYVKQVNTESISLITERFHTPDLMQIAKPIWTFDGQNQIQEGDARQNEEPRWCYRQGLTSLPKRMAEDLTIHFETRVISLQQHTSGWQLFTETNTSLGSFDRVLITLPASQAVPLINASRLDQTLQSTLLAYLEKARYNSLLSVVLGYHPRPQSRPYYALVNTDKAHAISWLAWEHEKSPQRAPADAGLLIAQMSPDYSTRHYDIPIDTLIADVTEHMTGLLGENLSSPIFRDVQRWRYALPAHKADQDALHTVSLPHGLAFAGDAFVGGRIQLALENGILAGTQLTSSRTPSELE